MRPDTNGDQLGNPVHFRQRDVHHPRHVPDGGLAPQGAERDDLGDLVVAVFARAVFEHLGAAVVAEVQVDIGHGDAPGIEEALEDQPVLERIDQGDVQRVGDDRAGRRTAGVVPDVMFAGIAAQVPHDQEVGVEAHLVDHAQLVVQAFADLWAVRVVLDSVSSPPLRTAAAGRSRR